MAAAGLGADSSASGDGTEDFDVDPALREAFLEALKASEEGRASMRSAERGRSFRELRDDAKWASQVDPFRELWAETRSRSAQDKRKREPAEHSEETDSSLANKDLLREIERLRRRLRAVSVLMSLSLATMETQRPSAGMACDRAPFALVGTAMTTNDR